MEKYLESIVSSTVKYLYNLQYLARVDKKSLTDLFDLQIIQSTYDWGIWTEKSEVDKRKLEILMSTIINRNPNLTFVKTQFNTYYTNVNTPQTIWTWQRIYDNFTVATHNTL